MKHPLPCPKFELDWPILFPIKRTFPYITEWISKRVLMSTISNATRQAALFTNQLAYFGMLVKSVVTINHQLTILTWYRQIAKKLIEIQKLDLSKTRWVHRNMERKRKKKCVLLCVHVCLCLCVWEKEKKRKEIERERKRKKKNVALSVCVYIYIYMCVCVCVWEREKESERENYRRKERCPPW